MWVRLKGLYPSSTTDRERSRIDDGGVVVRRAPRDLVDRGRHPGRRHQLVDLRGGVVRHPDRPGPARVLRLDEPLPGLRPRLARAAASAPARGPRGPGPAPAARPRASRASCPARSGGSLVVTKSSSRSTPESARARPTSRSLAYIVAVSTCRKPTSSAARTASYASAPRACQVPKPSRGISTSPVGAVRGTVGAGAATSPSCRTRADPARGRCARSRPLRVREVEPAGAERRAAAALSGPRGRRRSAPAAGRTPPARPRRRSWR